MFLSARLLITICYFMRYIEKVLAQVFQIIDRLYQYVLSMTFYMLVSFYKLFLYSESIFF